VRSSEFIAGQLLSIHNLTFYRALMRAMRESIIAGSFRDLYDSQVEALSSDDLDNPPKPPPVNNKMDRTILGNYQVVIPEGRSAAIRHRASGETMHISEDPRMESRALYVEGSRLLARTSEGGEEALVVWDVGLGAATNSMVGIHALEALESLGRPVTIISFENDLDSLKLALQHPWHFPHLRHGAPHKLLRDGVWKSAKHAITWVLKHGDFMDHCDTVDAPDIVWFDPFSAKVDSPMWRMPVLAKVLAATNGKATSLHTYSASTAIRASLLQVGWFVGRGVGTGQKRETTKAYTEEAVRRGLATDLLDSTWLGRWERSDCQVPVDVDPEPFKAAIRGHRQFGL
jgi:queuine tRNA-ribosyltransferase